MNVNPLEMLLLISKQRDGLKKEYDKWLVKCFEEGYSNVTIAKTLNITEAAIRMYRSRNSL